MDPISTADHEHYLWDGHEMSGPFAAEEVSHMVELGKVPEDAKIAVAGTEEWLPIAQWLKGLAPKVIASDSTKVTVHFSLENDLLSKALIKTFKKKGFNPTITADDSPERNGVWLTDSSGKEIEFANDTEVEKEEDVEVTATSLSIISENFYATAKQSQNKRFTIGWNPSGFRLLRDKAVVARGNGSGIGHGIVTDEGLGVLASYDGIIAGCLFGINPEGERTFKIGGLTPVHDMVTTPDQKTLICAAYKGEGDCILLIDLPEGRQRQRIPLVHNGIVGTIRYNPDSMVIEVQYEKRGPVHHYSIQGEFLEAATWNQDRILYFSGYELLDLALERAKLHLPGRVPEDVVDLFKSALRHSVSKYARARIHRWLGESLAANGDTTGAVVHLRCALKLDSKVGCMKLLQKLEIS